MKRTLSFLFTICLLLGLAPSSTLCIEAGAYGSLTEETFINKVSQLMVQYPDGKYWNEYNGVDEDGIALAGDKICPGTNKVSGKKCTTEGYCGIRSKAGCTCLCGKFHGWQCHGFANLMAYKIFGSYAISTGSDSSGLNSSKGWTYSTSVSEYYAGDFVRVNDYSHSIFIYKVDGNTITYVDCNNTGSPCQIDWGKTISVSSLKSKTSYVVHLTGNTLKGIKNTVDPTISYTDIAAGNYYLKNKATGKYLTVEDGTDAEKQTIYLDQLVSANKNAQVYKIYKATDGYEIMPLCSTTRVVNPYCWTVEPGKVINLYSLTNESSQWWKFQKVGDAYALRNVQNPSVCLTNSSGDSLTVETYTGAGSQLWILEPHYEQYKISYNANGGTGAPASQTKVQGVNLTLSSKKPTRVGYTFLGWSTNSAAVSATYQPGGTFKSDKSVTLYAVWQKGCESGKHNYDFAGSVAPTATSTGTLNGVCSCCSGTIKETLPKLNETDYTYMVTVEPTCTENGTGCYTYKSVSYAVTVKIPATGHNLQKDEDAIAATCTTAGMTAGYICANNCGHVEGGAVIPPIPHQYENGICTVCGFDRYAIMTFELNETGDGYIVTGCDESASGELEVPAIYQGLPVIGIGMGAFSDCTSLTSISIPDSIICVEGWAFSGCDNLSYNTYGEGKYLGNSNNPYVMLVGITTKELSTYSIHPDTKIIGSAVFSDCANLTSITLPDGVTCLGDNVFEGCSALTGITIPDGVTSIGSFAFYGCSNLAYANIPDGVTEVSGYAFAACESLASINIPEGITQINVFAFIGCRSLTSITLPSSLTYIQDWAFDSCTGLTSVIIPEGVIWISYCGFSNCSGLTSIVIPGSVTEISYRAFDGCDSLSTVTFCGTQEQWNTIAMDDGNEPLINAALQFHDMENGACTICGYDNSPLTFTLNETCDGYIVSDCETSATGELVIPEIYNGLPVTSIGDWAFNGCTGLTDITIPDCVTSIGEGAFSSCNGLLCITIPNRVTAIGSHAFRECSDLTSITIPASVTSIGSYAFQGCYSLVNITIPNGVTSIGDVAFSGCTGLTSIAIPNSITNIGGYAFHNCAGLTSVTYCGTEEQWNTIAMDDGNEPLTSAALQYHNYENGVCTGCGKTNYIAGDFDGDEKVTCNDAVYLLIHAMFGEQFYPLNNVPGDIDGNGTVDQDDAVYLLLHALFGEQFYPLNTPALPSSKEELIG